MFWCKQVYIPEHSFCCPLDVVVVVVVVVVVICT